MNFHNIKYFLAIVNDSSISKAAEHLHISQQSLSEQLKKMEDEIGAQLIRRGRQITLTPAGKIFKRSAEELLDTYQNMLDEIATVSGKDKTQITLAIPATETPPFLPGLLTVFAAEHPELKITIMKCQPREAVKESANFDLYFSTFPLDDELKHEPVLEDDSFAVAFARTLAERIYGDRWSGIEAQLIEQKDISILREMPFILLDNQENEVVLDQEMIFKEAGFEPEVSFRSGNSDLNANMCILGSGGYVAIMDSCRRRFGGELGKGNEILIYPINTCFDPVNIVLSYRRGMQLTKAEVTFIESAREYIRSSLQ